MGVIYRCESCGVAMDVTPGASGFPGMSMTCSNCGAKARYSPSPPSDDTDVIAVRLDAGEETSVLAPLDDAGRDEQGVLDSGDAPTVRTTGIDEVLAARALEAAPALHPPTVTPAAAKPSRAGLPDPSLSFRSPEAGGHTGGNVPLMVTRIRSASEVAATTPSAPAQRPAAPTPVAAAAPPAVSPAELAEEPAAYAGRDENDTDRGFPQRDFRDEARAQRDQLPGKAWSASVIRKRLHESGYEDSGAHQSTENDPVDDDDEGAVTTMLEPPEDLGERVRVEVPKTVRPDRKHVGGHLATDETISASPLSEPAPQTAGTVTPRSIEAPSSGSQRTPSRSQPAAHRRPSAEVMESVLYQERARRRHLLITVLLGAVLVAGAIYAYLRSRAVDPTDPAPVGVLDGPDAPDQLAERRAQALGLEPLAAAAPVRIDAETVLADYPDRLILSLTLHNEGDQPITVLQVGGTWHQVHDMAASFSGHVTSADRDITPAAPLAPGESTTRLLEFEGGITPSGAPRESFVWLEVTAGGTSDILFDGPVAMVEVRTR